MMKVTEKGKALLAKNGGILKIQNTENGYFDYSEFETWAEVFEDWAKDCGGWNLYEGEEKTETEVYSAEESKDRLTEEFENAAFETSIDEIIKIGDIYGIGEKFGYVEDVEE